MVRCFHYIASVISILCAIAPSSAFAAYCNRVQYFEVSATYCNSSDGRCDYRRFDFKQHAVGSCMSGSCYDGQGIGWVQHGVYFGRFRNGYPEGEGTLRLGSLDANSQFVETLALTGTFRDGCMIADVRATVPASAIYWEGNYDEESGASSGTWYLAVTNPGHNVAPLVLARGGLSAQPTRAFAEEALRRENARTGSTTPASGTPSKSPTPAEIAPPVVPVFRIVPDETTVGPLPLSGNVDEDATSVAIYIRTAKIDRNAPLSPHMQELFRPIYARAVQLYESTDPKISKGVATALSEFYERGWLVPKDNALHIRLFNYAYEGQAKPPLPAPGTASPAAPAGTPAPVLAERSPAPTESTTQPLFISSNDYRALEDAYFYLSKAQIPLDKPLSAGSTALLRPVFDNLVRIYDESIGSMSAHAGDTLVFFYERGWIVPKDPALVKDLRHYGTFLDMRPGLTNLPAKH